MIEQVFCVLLPLLSGCSPYRQDVPTISALVQNAPRFTGHVVAVTGTARSLRQWHYKDGYRSEIFTLCDASSCVTVYKKANSPIHDGELLTVRGTFYDNLHIEGRIYDNEVDAGAILPLD